MKKRARDILKKIYYTTGLYKLRYFYVRSQSAIGWYKTRLPIGFRAIRKSVSIGFHSYDITLENKKYLANMVSVITKKPYGEIFEYIQELEQNNSFHQHFQEIISKDYSLLSMYGHRLCMARRSGWYALVRAMKPKVVVETGIASGIGSCVVTQALMKNQSEGFEGHYYGMEINPKQGVFFKEPFTHYGETVLGDVFETLKKVEKIDLLITDISNNYDLEMKQYLCVYEHEKLSEDAIILSNNSHGNTALQTFANETGRKFLFHMEEPVSHWRKTNSVGIAFN